MTSLRSCRGIVLLIAASALGLASAAGPSGSVVRVTAVVTNARGEPVAGLRASDFQITVDGTPQAVDGIEFKTGTPNTPRAFGLVLDEFHVDASDSTAVREALAPFVDAMRPGDVAARLQAARFADRHQADRRRPGAAQRHRRLRRPQGRLHSADRVRAEVHGSGAQRRRRSTGADRLVWPARCGVAPRRIAGRPPRGCAGQRRLFASARRSEPSRQACSQPSESRTAATCPFTCSRQGKPQPIRQKPSRPGRCSRAWPCRREENSSAGSRRLATA